jgi:hypothetical protein
MKYLRAISLFVQIVWLPIDDRYPSARIRPSDAWAVAKMIHL